jgi:large subunit ribosomal protein L24|tara:strand:+ start:1226 stop:1558 length:333 start_codon:yes stop_codon:yes gene_type:complete
MMSKAGKIKIKKGDEVVVIVGRDRGKKGNVLRVIPSERRLIVQGINMVKHHTRASAASTAGIVDKESPIHVSNVAVVDPKTGKSSRVGIKTIKDGTRMRYARASGEIIDG